MFAAENKNSRMIHIGEVLGAMRSAKGSRHIWLLLTKRTRRLAELSQKIGGLPDNCMAMTTITNQRTANARLPFLSQVRARYHGISAEPLRGCVDLYSACGALAADIDWVITGGASGVNGAEMPDEWASKLWSWCGDAAAALKERCPVGASDDPRPRMEKACERLSEPL